ncbi:MAG: bifunctional heptose 7-phosphate kinase/heptose 1-phosphate adenyltransferase [Desulfohalobiaceae bacterium]
MKQANPARAEAFKTAAQAQVSIAELLLLAQRLNQSQVLVTGDIMLDHYQYGAADRISPEAPVPVVRIENEEYKLGGAGNVARNLQSLGAAPLLLAQTGQDPEAAELQNLLQQCGIQHELLQSPKRRTTVKTRVLAQGQQVVRVDRESRAQDQEQDQKFRALLQDRLRSCKTLIVSDYGKGCITPSLLQTLQGQDPEQTRILLDPKQKNYSLYPGFFLMTPNRKEASWFSKLQLGSQEDILAAGDQILADKRCSNVLITLGPAGMVLFCADSSVWKIPAVTQKVFDVTGAGDTVIAILAAALDAGGTPLQGCMLANAAAALVVGQVGTAWVSVQELQGQLQSKAEELQLEKWR